MKLILLVLLVVLVGCEQVIIKDTVEIKELNKPYKIELSEPANCYDYGGWEAISRLTYNKTLCIKFDKFPCYIDIIKDFELNKEYCNFQPGDIIYIYSK